MFLSCCTDHFRPFYSQGRFPNNIQEHSPHHTRDPLLPDMFKRESTWTSATQGLPPPTFDIFKPVAYVAHTVVGNRAVGIEILKCLFVSNNNHSFNSQKSVNIQVALRMRFRYIKNMHRMVSMSVHEPWMLSMYTNSRWFI